MFVITKDWIFKHRTDKGAWTKAQISALGLLWPPTKNWISDLVGTEIAEENRIKFEEGKNKRSGSNRKGVNLKLDSALGIVLNGVKKLSDNNLLRLIDAAAKELEKR